MSNSNFEDRLTGGHPNSLGNTVEIVEEVLTHPDLLEELFLCYQSNDEIVRLRTSNGIKRICIANQDLVVPYIDRLVSEVSLIDQPSAQWTLSQLFLLLQKKLTVEQRSNAVEIMKTNLASSKDWIVLNMTMETLGKWAIHEEQLREWLIPHLEEFMDDKRNSVSKKASKTLALLKAKS